MTPAVTLSVASARQANHIAVWARRMAKRFDRKFYTALAKKSRATAKSHLADARRWRDAA